MGVRWNLNSLGVGGQLVKVLQGLCIRTFSTLDFMTFIRLSQSFRGEEGVCHGALFPAFRGTE